MGPLPGKRNRIASGLELVSRSPRETRALGARLGELAAPGDLILLVGELGTGKTCLTQGIAWGLGIEEYAASPSFVLVREYRGRLPLYHIDLYRLEGPEEVAHLGLDEYLYGGGLCVVEWAAKGLGILPPEHLLVRLEHLSPRRRRIELEPRGGRYQAMISGLEPGG